MLRALRVGVVMAIAWSFHARAADPVKIPPAEKGAVVQHGTASFYADRFHGRRTASGETMDQDAFTAASKSLPLGTYVRVTNLKSGEIVLVRINDRGPHAPGRIIDLSKRAAEALGINRRNGVARVRVEVLPGDQATDELREEIAARAGKR